MKQNQDTKIGIIIAAITVLVFAIIISLARSNNSNAISESVDQESITTTVLAADESLFDFGTISMAAGKVSHIFKVKNPTDSPIMLTKIYTSCMCTSAILTKGGKKYGPFGMPGHGVVPKINVALQPGEEADVETIFDPAAHGPAGVGYIDRIVYVESKSGEPLELRFTATVTP